MKDLHETSRRRYSKDMEKQLTLSDARPLAEQLPPNAAEYAIRHFESRRTPAGLLHSAWSHVEYALCRSVSLDNRLRETYFDYTQELLGEIIRADVSTEIYGREISRSVSQDTLLGALTLSSYVPLFRKRALEQSASHRDCTELYNSLAEAITYLRPLQIDEPPQWRMAEVATLALSARTTRPNLLLYPASPREESAPEGLRNHDSYFMTTDDKIPLQQKLIRTERTYDTCITILTLEPLLDRGASRAQLTTELTSADKINRLLALIVAEAHEQELAPEEKHFLDQLTRALVAHRFQGQQRLTAA